MSLVEDEDGAIGDLAGRVEPASKVSMGALLVILGLVCSTPALATVDNLPADAEADVQNRLGLQLEAASYAIGSLENGHWQALILQGELAGFDVFSSRVALPIVHVVPAEGESGTALANLEYGVGMALLRSEAKHLRARLDVDFEFPTADGEHGIGGGSGAFKATLSGSGRPVNSLAVLGSVRLRTPLAGPGMGDQAPAGVSTPQIVGARLWRPEWGVGLMMTYGERWGYISLGVEAGSDWEESSEVETTLIHVEAGVAWDRQLWFSGFYDRPGGDEHRATWQAGLGIEYRFAERSLAP
jgi:hypothetical protein